MTDTQTTEAAVELLTGKAREAAQELATLGNAVFAEITQGGLDHVATTLQLIMQLQPTLNRELAKVQRTDGDVKAGKFHAHMTSLITSIGDEAVTWKLDANTTFMAASFKRNAKAWSAYTNLVSKGGEPTLKRYVRFQERFALGHYDGQGALTTAGEAWDEEQRELDFTKQTNLRNRQLKAFDEIDWSDFLDEGYTSEDELTFWHRMAYYANARTLKMERNLRRSDAGKATIAAARATVKDEIAI